MAKFLSVRRILHVINFCAKHIYQVAVVAEKGHLVFHFDLED